MSLLAGIVVRDYATAANDRLKYEPFILVLVQVPAQIATHFASKNDDDWADDLEAHGRAKVIFFSAQKLRKASVNGAQQLVHLTFRSSERLANEKQKRNLSQPQAKRTLRKQR